MANLKLLDKYTDGLDMNQFTHIKDISYYCHNYYIGFDNNMIFGKCDDDDTTEWYVILNHPPFQTTHYLGESYCSDGDKLYRHNR